MAQEAFHQQQMARISATWGDPPGIIMADAGGFLIPGIHLQKLFIGLQPSRGVYEDAAKQYHGEYLDARLGGDLMRDPKVFPTGGNLVQFDPRRDPSATAMARGGEIAASTLAHYRLHHNGAYPLSELQRPRIDCVVTICGFFSGHVPEPD